MGLVKTTLRFGTSNRKRGNMPTVIIAIAVALIALVSNRKKSGDDAPPSGSDVVTSAGSLDAVGGPTVTVSVDGKVQLPSFESKSIWCF